MKTRKHPATTGSRLKPKKNKAQLLSDLARSFEQYQELQDQKLKELGKALATIWQNQVELTKSADRLDEQFCVLARMSIVKINETMIRLSNDDVVDEKAIAKYFMDWATFKARPDFRKYMMEWFLGVPLDQLPPPPEVKEEKPQEAPNQKAEGPKEFGGDYGTGQASDDGNPAASEVQQPDDRGSQTDAVPDRQDPNGPTP
jgi:hypothetical protein